MFCGNCGKEIDKNAVVCPFCGVPTQEKNEKTMLIAILLCLFLGYFGAHRFYLNQNGTAIAQLILNIVGWLTCWILIGFIPLLIVWIWVLVDLIMIATGSLTTPDGKKLS